MAAPIGGAARGAELRGKPRKTNKGSEFRFRAFFKSGGGGFGLCVIPSLDLVLYKMAGDDPQYDPARTRLDQTYPYDHSRDNWKPPPKTQFSDGPIGTDDGLRRTIEMTAAAVVR